MAEELARTALEMARRTEAPCLQADVIAELASVLHLAGKSCEARDVIGEAIALYSAKGNIVSAARATMWAAGLNTN